MRELILLNLKKSDTEISIYKSDFIRNVNLIWDQVILIGRYLALKIRVPLRVGYASEAHMYHSEKYTENNPRQTEVRDEGCSIHRDVSHLNV